MTQKHSTWYATVKRFYDAGHEKYTKEAVRGFVVTGMIYDWEYELITGIPYEE